MVDFTPLFHAIAAVSFQIATGILSDDWLTGGVVGSLWFIAREQTQAEYRWIAKLGGGHRANMPWWGGFDYRAWDVASLLDFAVPMAACLSVWLIAR